MSDLLTVPDRKIMDRVAFMLDGMDKRATLIACLSIAATTSRLIGMPKLEVQTILVRLIDKRIAEEVTKRTTI